MSWRRFLIILSSVALAEGPSYAAQWCTGTIKATYSTQSGAVLIYTSYRNDWTQLCNITATWKGISPVLCNLWVSYVTTARAAQIPVSAYYSDYTCDAVPSYESAPAAHNFALWF